MWLETGYYYKHSSVQLSSHHKGHFTICYSIILPIKQDIANIVWIITSKVKISFHHFPLTICVKLASRIIKSLPTVSSLWIGYTIYSLNELPYACCSDGPIISWGRWSSDYDITVMIDYERFIINYKKNRKSFFPQICNSGQILWLKMHSLTKFHVFSMLFSR